MIWLANRKSDCPGRIEAIDARCSESVSKNPLVEVTDPKSTFRVALKVLNGITQIHIRYYAPIFGD